MLGLFATGETVVPAQTMNYYLEQVSNTSEPLSVSWVTSIDFMSIHTWLYNVYTIALIPNMALVCTALGSLYAFLAEGYSYFVPKSDLVYALPNILLQNSVKRGAWVVDYNFPRKNHNELDVELKKAI